MSEQPDFNALAQAITTATAELNEADRVVIKAQEEQKYARGRLRMVQGQFDEAVRGLRGDTVPEEPPVAPDTTGADLATPRVLQAPFKSPRHINGVLVAPIFNSNSRAEEDRIG